MMTSYIYGLVDPETKEIRYVGVTNNLDGRLKQHLVQKGKDKKSLWVQDLKSKGLVPSIIVLQRIPDNSLVTAQEIERIWIYRFQHLWNLTNSAPCKIKFKKPAFEWNSTDIPFTHELQASLMKCAKGKHTPLGEWHDSEVGGIYYFPKYDVKKYTPCQCFWCGKYFVVDHHGNQILESEFLHELSKHIFELHQEIAHLVKSRQDVEMKLMRLYSREEA